MYYILNAKGEICGESLDLFTPADGLRLIAKADYHSDPQAALATAKATKLHAAATAAQAFIETVAGLDGVPQIRARLMGVASRRGASVGSRQERGHADIGRHCTGARRAAG